jgi:sulfide:quinone oxidoreductase
VVAGGGIAGLEALLALADLAEDRVELTLVTPQPEFLYKPLLVEEPFDVGPAERHELAPLAQELGAKFILNGLASVRPEDHTLELEDGSELAYDKLVVCVGGRFRPAFEIGTIFPGPEPLEIDAILDRAAAEFHGRVAFVVPPGVSWPLPIYEVALMTERRAGERGIDVQLSVITPEQAPLAVFGQIPSDAVATLLAGREVEVETAAYAHELDGELVLSPGDRRVEASEVVALPVLEGPAVAGLPSDDGGFIPIDDHARVVGVEDVYAAGDGANFPIKQGGIGTQQADAAAQDIAAAAGADLDPKPFHPVLRGKLLTGETTLSLRQDVAGGGGEGVASADYLWWPPHKVSGHYLATLLDQQGKPRGENVPPPSPAVDVEVAFPEDWHRDPMGLDPYSPGPHG